MSLADSSSWPTLVQNFFQMFMISDAEDRERDLTGGSILWPKAILLLLLLLL